MFRRLSRLATDVVAEVVSLPIIDSTPARRLGLGMGMLLDMQGETLLEFLGEDLSERATTLEQMLGKMTDEQLEDLFAAFHEAAQRRAMGETKPERSSGLRHGRRAR